MFFGIVGTMKSFIGPSSEPALGMGETGPWPGPRTCPVQTEPPCDTVGFCHHHFIYCKILPFSLSPDIMTKCDFGWGYAPDLVLV